MPISSPSPYRESLRRCEDDRSPRSTSPQPITKNSTQFTHKRKRKSSYSSQERARKNSDSDDSKHHKKKNSSQPSPKHNRKYSTSPPLTEQYEREKYTYSPSSKKRYKRDESSSSSSSSSEDDGEYKSKKSSSISENEDDHHRTESPTIKHQRRKKSSDSNSHKERELSISPSTSTHHKKSGKHKRRESNDDVRKPKKKKKDKRKDFEDDREAIVYDDDIYNKNDYNNLEKLEQLKESRYRDKSNDRSNREQFRLSKDYERFNRNQDQRYSRREEFNNKRGNLDERPYSDRGSRRPRYRHQEEKYDEPLEEYEDGYRNEKKDREKSNDRRGRERSNDRKGRERSNERRDRARSNETRDRERSNETRDRERSLEQRKKRETDKNKKDEANENLDNEEEPPVRKKKEEEILGSKTGGAYIPPAKLRMMQARITDKSSIAYQRIAWEALKKSINGLINKVNVSNITEIVRELLQENIVRGRGLLSRSIIQAQAASPTFTHVYAALVSIINSKFPQNGELILKRLILQFRRAFKRNDKPLCLSSTRFIAHLVNQQVVHEVVALEILTLLLENPTDDSVELSTGFLKECGQQLTDVSPRGIHAIFERLRSILHEGQIDKRVQYMIEVMHAVRKDGFADHPAVITELDLIEENDQFTHLITLEDEMNAEDILNVFKHDPEYEANEDKYIVLKREILDEDSSNEGDSSGKESGEESDDAEDDEQKTTIIDNTETNLIAFRRTVYLAIQSSLDFEECAHKLLKIEFKPGQEVELCHMILDCCSQQRTYEKFYGLLAQRFCQLNKIYVEPFEKIFKDSYDTIHRLETNKLRNVAKCFAHLLYTDAISWTVLAYIRLNEDDTTSSSRIFIKILFQELSEYMGLPKLNERLKDPTLQEAFDGLFPRDNPRNTRFAINFFTSIGLGGLTDELREHLKNIPKALAAQKQQKVSSSSGSSSSSSSSSTASSSSEESSSSSSSSASSSESSSDSESDSESGSASSSRSSSSS